MQTPSQNIVKNNILINAFVLVNSIILLKRNEGLFITYLFSVESILF